MRLTGMARVRLLRPSASSARATEGNVTRAASPSVTLGNHLGSDRGNDPPRDVGLSARDSPGTPREFDRRASLARGPRRQAPRAPRARPRPCGSTRQISPSWWAAQRKITRAQVGASKSGSGAAPQHQHGDRVSLIGSRPRLARRGSAPARCTPGTRRHAGCGRAGPSIRPGSSPTSGIEERSQGFRICSGAT